MNRSHLRAALILAGGLTVAWLTGALAPPAQAQAPAAAPAPPAIKAVVPASKPAWSKGIQPINRDSYYHAIECGKLGGEQPSCVFYDADLCKNDDFVLAMYSPYKQVAYEVWGAVSRKRPVPTPSYSAAQQTRVVIGVTPVRGAKNQIAAVTRAARRQGDRRRHAHHRRHLGELHLRLPAVCADGKHHDRDGGEDPHAVLPHRPHRPLPHALTGRGRGSSDPPLVVSPVVPSAGLVLRRRVSVWGLLRRTSTPALDDPAAHAGRWPTGADLRPAATPSGATCL